MKIHIETNNATDLAAHQQTIVGEKKKKKKFKKLPPNTLAVQTMLPTQQPTNTKCWKRMKVE